MKKDIYSKKIDTKRQNAFWYKGVGEIAKFTKDDREVIISSCGLIRVKFPNEDFYRKNIQAVDIALSHSLYDKDLEKLEFEDCNWFDFVYKTSNMNNFIEIDGDEEFNYSKAIKSAKEILKDDEFWKQFLR